MNTIVRPSVKIARRRDVFDLFNMDAPYQAPGARTSSRSDESVGSLGTTPETVLELVEFLTLVVFVPLG